MPNYTKLCNLFTNIIDGVYNKKYILPVLIFKQYVANCKTNCQTDFFRKQGGG